MNANIPTAINQLINSNDSHDLDIKQKIVEELLDNTKNLPTKTELNQPVKWSTLQILVQYLKSKGMIIAANLLEEFINKSFTYLISKDRKGRLEYLQALQAEQKQDEIKQNPLSMVGTNNEIKRKN